MAKPRKPRRGRKPHRAPSPTVAGRRARLQLWKRWLDAIETEIFGIAHRRRLYRETREMVEKNPRANVPSTWFAWLQGLYVNDTSVAVRRQVDWDKRSISMIQLIDDIARNPHVITRRRFVSTYDKAMKRHAHRDFEKFGKPGAQQIDPRVIRTDVKRLIEARRASKPPRHEAPADIRRIGCMH